MQIELIIHTEHAASCAHCDAALCRAVVARTLAMSGVSFAEDACVSLSLVWIDDATMQERNAAYRNKAHTTDVLSFGDAFAEHPAPGVDGIDVDKVVTGACMLGDILCSCATITRYATIDAVDPRRAHILVIAHGVLHLLGYDHSPQMFAIQESVTTAFA